MATGRYDGGRSIAIGTTSGSAALTASAGTFEKTDVGRTVTGTGIPASATISAVASGTAATLSANATATGSPTVALGTAVPGNIGFTGWSPESDPESLTYSIAGGASASAPDRITNVYTAVQQRARG